MKKKANQKRSAKRDLPPRNAGGVKGGSVKSLRPGGGSQVVPSQTKVVISP